MTLKCIGTGSSGNCYLLISDNGETLILDCGLPIKEIKKGLDWNIENVVGCVVTHAHQDHSKSAKDLSDIGIPVFTPYDSMVANQFLANSYFSVRPFDLTTVYGRWTHTNADGSECPCYGFLIIHKEMGRMLYITDTELIKWRFKDINHILLGVNYDKELVDSENQSKNNHIFRGHLEIGTACDFVSANNSSTLQNVIMCHLSSENADNNLFVDKMKNVACMANVFVAERGLEVELRNKNECPF